MWRSMVVVAAMIAMSGCGRERQTQNEYWSQCHGTDPDRAIAACTALIESGKEQAANLADVFYRRGLAYEKLGRAHERTNAHNLAIAELDHAIADYD